MAPDEHPTQVNGPGKDLSQLKEISRAMVRIYKGQLGRGPDRVRSHYAGPDVIVCLLEGTLTPVERTLSTMGEHQRLRDMRTLFQHAAQDESWAAVEEITGRKVTAFLSGVDINADIASAVFTLVPFGLDDVPAQQ